MASEKRYVRCDGGHMRDHIKDTKTDTVIGLSGDLNDIVNYLNRLAERDKLLTDALELSNAMWLKWLEQCGRKSSEKKYRTLTEWLYNQIAPQDVADVLRGAHEALAAVAKERVE